MAFTIQKMPAVVMAFMFVILFLGITVYVLNEIATQANISTISTLTQKLGDWGLTWIPILLVVIGAGLVIGVLIRSFGGR
ncbi:MAG: hypothetical protein QXL14_02180 [Candidatus Aenigmatarchaeota archaeon]